MVIKIKNALVALSAVAAATPAIAQAPAAGQPAQQPAAPAAAPANPAQPGTAVETLPAGIYSRTTPLSVGDVVNVSVLGRSDYNLPVRVAGDGVVILPLLGSVKAAGRTPDQLADDVRQGLSKGQFFANPAVRVDIISIASRYATVLGYVGSPGLVNLDRTYKLSELLARVGGRTGSGANYVVLTRPDGKNSRYYIDDLATGVGEDPVVVEGDKVFIPPVDNELAYINGSVRNPGSIPANSRTTIRLAIAKAGGVTETGNDKKLKLVRDGKEVKPVNLDDKLLPGDVLTVGQKMF